MRNDTSLTLHKVIANELGLTTKQVAAIERTALRKIRRLLAARGLRFEDLLPDY